MVTLKEDTRKSIAELTLMDDIFMNKVFENDIGRTALLLRIILKNDKIKVIKATTQQKLKNLLGHDLQLDILAQNENGTLFNVEIQNQSSGAAARRARYHLSLLDSLSLPCLRARTISSCRIIMLFLLLKMMYSRAVCRYITSTGKSKKMIRLLLTVRISSM